MISIPQPAMAMNSHDVPPPRYRFANTWDVAANITPQHLMGWAAHVLKECRDKAPDNELSLVINCHSYGRSGRGGYGLKIGTGIRRSDAIQFEKIAPFVDTIYIVSCEAAYIDASGDGDGNLLICAIAKAAQAHVWAATADQYGPPWVPYGCIDDFAGTVLVYGPDGSVEHSYNFD